MLPTKLLFSVIAFLMLLAAFYHNFFVFVNPFLKAQTFLISSCQFCLIIYLTPLTLNVENRYRHSNKLNVKLQTRFYFSTCIMNTETQLPSIIQVHFNSIIASSIKFNSNRRLQNATARIKSGFFL